MDYFYGEEGDAIFDSELNDVCNYKLQELNSKNEYKIILEMKIKKGSEKWCKLTKEFIDDCGQYYCSTYRPRNKKNGICEYLSWGLYPTGRKFKLYGDGKIKKISSRRKSERI